jgi:putative ABC transport system permease protein
MSTRDRKDDEFAREIEVHLELEAEALMRDGLDPETARDKARAAFGNVTAARERHYERQRWPWLDHLRQDVRAAFRAMRRYPIAACVAILSLGFGIGATTITLTVRDVIFRRPPPLYREPANISRVQFGTPANPILRSGSRVPSRLYAIWSASPRAIDIGGSLPQIVREVRISSGFDAEAGARTGDAESTRTEMIATRPVTPSLFAVLGVEPIIGRAFSNVIGGESAPTPAVLSYRVWRQLFDGRADITGQVFWIDHQPFAVSGVMPERFWFGSMDAPIYIPADVRRLGPEDALEVVARRPAGMTPAQLDAQLRSGLDEYARQQPAGQRQVQIEISGIEGTPAGHQIATVVPYLLATSVLLTLLIACANVAVLMIAQWTVREHEVAIRAAIGASRGRVVRALLTESVVIALAGGVLGVAATLVLRAIIIRNGGAIAFYDLSIDPRVYITTALIAVLTGVVAGLAPALHETRRLQGNPLRSMGAADRVRQRWRHALVVFEITVTIALLVQTSSLIDGYRRAMSADMGFATAPLIAARVENPAGVQITTLLDAIRSLPGVEAAAVSTSMPFGARGSSVRVAAAASGASAASPESVAPAASATSSPAAGRGGSSEAINAEHAEITSSFFSALGVPLRAGRAFAESESHTLRTAIVNDTLATRLFGDRRRAIGATIQLADTPYDIVGVVADYANDPLRVATSQPRVFTPLPLPLPGAASAGNTSTGAASTGAAAASARAAAANAANAAGVSVTPARPPRVSLLIRAQAPAPLVRTLRRELRDAAAGNVVTSAFTVDEVIKVMGQEILVGVAPLTPLMSIGVLLTAAGIYGVLAFAVARRGRELAVRVAMGASRGDLVRLVTMHTLRLVGAGVCFGLGVTFALARVIRVGGGAGSVFDPMPIAFIVPAALIVVLGIAAAWLPARRASAIDPVVLLRNS